MQSYQFGVSCENVAQKYLISKGYKILRRRYKAKCGEIDLVALKDKTLVFVEVKARKKDELIEVLLRPQQVSRIRNAALMFMAENLCYDGYDMRFDFVLFTGMAASPQHFEGYF